ncbi:single-stranded-DNA-specific exonuclease RecJ [Chloroflexota bacterium]
MSHSIWQISPPVPEDVLSGAGFGQAIRQLLYNRGITSEAEASRFFSGAPELAHDPFLLPDIQPAINRIYRALLSGEHITIYGDYDVDGITSTALMVQGLTLLGGHVTPYIPHRLAEGYGLTVSAIDKLRKEGASLIVTVDCGVTSLNEVAKANKQKMDIIVTDHHTPFKDSIPAAVAVIDPKIPGCRYPFTELAGVGVAYKLLQALFINLGRPDEADYLLDLVAMGTIADMCPLAGENRFLVIHGLKIINQHPRLGLNEIINLTGLIQGKITADRISWVIAPYLNAAGRLAHALTSYNLLMTEDPLDAFELASQLERKNSDRQKLTKNNLDQAREQILSGEIGSLLLAANQHYHLGIAGLVAGRLAEEFYRPSIVLRIGEKTSSGSCRSIPGFNIIKALQNNADLLLHFGGHAQAAGLTLATENIGVLTRRLSADAAAVLEGTDIRPTLPIDAVLSFSALDRETYDEMEKLAPFGRGNERPTFISEKVQVLDCRTMGAENNHLRFRFRRDGRDFTGVGFRLGKYINQVAHSMDIVYQLEINTWNNHNNLRLNVLDFESFGAAE